jgi:electron transfer flavoprotein beta subunit
MDQMKIAVCVKTPSGAAVDAKEASIRSGRFGPNLLSNFDKHAVEEALRAKEGAESGEVVVIAVGGAETVGALREALAMGGDRALLLCDPALDGADVLATSRALAAILSSVRADLYLTCTWSGDIDGTLLWRMTAERMDLPVMCQVSKLSMEDRQITGERQAENADLVLSCSLPALVEVTVDINKPRYATLKGKQLAKTKPLQLLKAGALSLQPELVGSRGAGTRVLSLARAPQARNTIVVEDESQAAERIHSFLQERKLLP